MKAKCQRQKGGKRMDTKREELINLRIRLLEPTDGEKAEAERFVNDMLDRIFPQQIYDDPKLQNTFLNKNNDDLKIDVCAVALKYVGEEFYQVMPWNFKSEKFINKGESKIPEKLLDMILRLAEQNGIYAFSEDEAREEGIIPEKEEEEDPLKKWGWKHPKEEANEEKKKDYYFLYKVSIEQERTEGIAKPQKETG